MKASWDRTTTRATGIDKYVGRRMRERRIMLGLTQAQLAEQIGITYQQAHKYEKGINRIACGRLYTIANALGVDTNYFYQGIKNDNQSQVTPQQRLLLELARNFMAIPTRKSRDAVTALARALAQDQA